VQLKNISWKKQIFVKTVLPRCIVQCSIWAVGDKKIWGLVMPEKDTGETIS
jgi:hypothetical protein